MSSKVITNFAITILLLIIMGLFSMYKMVELSNLTKKMYEHPYIVSNTTKSIQTKIVSMHRYMKDVSLAKTDNELSLAIERVNRDEKDVYLYYATVFKYYLGDRSDIEVSYKAFIEWKSIRDEIVFLTKNGKNKEAQQITQDEGYQHVLLLNKQVQTLIVYANHKAEEFFNSAMESKKEALIVTSIILTTIVLLIVIILIRLVQQLRNIEEEKQETLLLLYEAQAIAKVGTWKYDVKNDKLSWSEETYKMFERSPYNKVLHANDFFKQVHPDDLKMVEKSYQNHLNTHDPYVHIHRIITMHGNIRHVEQKCRTTFDSNGKALISNGVIQDITDTMNEKIDLNKKLVCDELTQTYNRFFFNKNIDLIIKQLDPMKHLGVVMIDIDFFKKVNDTYGHDVGDTVLQELTRTVKNSIREKDYFIRWGGEEFILLLETNSSDSLFNVLNKIRDTINTQEFFQVGHITCSFGATIYIDEEEIDTSLQRADKLLYLAKENGRDQIQI